MEAGGFCGAGYREVAGIVNGKHAWGILAGSVVVYECMCTEENLLSVVVDEWLETHPILTRVTIGAVALHLLNMLPVYADPLAKQLWKTIFGALGRENAH